MHTHHLLQSDKKIQTNVQKYIGRILAIYKNLQVSTDLAPSPRINKLFGDLVSVVIHAEAGAAERVIAHKEIKRIAAVLMRLCSKGEYLLELHWAKKIIQSKNPAKEMRKFTYFKNYQKIVHEEGKALRKHGRPIRRVLFVGSGPLPLSVIMMAEKWKIDAMDLSKESCAVSSKLLETLNLNKKINVIYNSILSVPRLSGYDLICVAALAGDNIKDKEKIIRHVEDHAKAGCLFLFRSSTGLGTLLYSQIRNSWLSKSEILKTIHPANDVINPVIIAQKRGSKNHIPHKTKKSLNKLLRQYDEYCRTEQRLKNISDAMIYPDPLAWIMYKYEAYKKTQHPILTVGDLRKHCSEPGDICTKRFDFLYNFLKGHYGIDITDPREYPSFMSLKTFYQSDTILHTLYDRHFMQFWHTFEYFKIKGKVAKWENYNIGSNGLFL